MMSEFTYNSDKPRKIGALAYTQGTQVHIGPGQERHLRHELGTLCNRNRESCGRLHISTGCR